MASHPNTKSVTFILQSMRPLYFCILSDEQIKKGVSFNTIKCKLRNFKCMAGECRWNVRKHRYISFGTLFLWTKNSTIAEFMVGKHFRELYPLVGNDACAGLFWSKQTIWRKKIWQLAVYCQIYKCHDFMPLFFPKTNISYYVLHRYLIFKSLINQKNNCRT